MTAKDRFREGWIMLLRPFKFAELTKPLQKMTILYAYSEQPIITMELTDKGRQEMELINEHYGKSSLLHNHPEYSKGAFETDDVYEMRMERVINRVYKLHATQENYQGQIVQCYVEKQLCRFYPDEYNVISRETFEHLLVCDEQEYTVEIEDNRLFESKDMKQRLFYIRNRGINKQMATKMCSATVKDSVIFRPGDAMLEMFCREHEILK